MHSCKSKLRPEHTPHTVLPGPRSQCMALLLRMPWTEVQRKLVVRALPVPSKFGSRLKVGGGGTRGEVWCMGVRVVNSDEAADEVCWLVHGPSWRDPDKPDGVAEATAAEHRLDRLKHSPVYPTRRRSRVWQLRPPTPVTGATGTLIMSEGLGLKVESWDQACLQEECWHCVACAKACLNLLDVQDSC